MTDFPPETLATITTQLAEIQEKLNQLSTLTQRVIKLEESLLLVSDIYGYQKLQKFLKQGDWFEADLETVNVILNIMGKTQEQLKPEDIRNFPINDLKVIDYLWRKYSNDRFGFSIQLQIYKELGGNLETTITNDRNLIEAWGEKLGWRQKNQWKKCEELDFSLSAPLGCHPSQWWNSPYGSKMTNYFLSRLMSVNL